MRMNFKATAARRLARRHAGSCAGCGGDDGGLRLRRRHQHASTSWATPCWSRPTQASSRPSRTPTPARTSSSRSPTAPPATRLAPSSPGQDADEVHLSLEPDVQKLVDEGIVADDWKDNDTKGICTQSVVVMVVRTGNPKGIDSWDDLIKPGVGIVTPNPALLRLREVEPPRGVRRRARRRRHRRGRPGVPREVLRQRRRPPGQRSGRHHRLHQRHRRRAALLRERGDPRQAERHRLRLRDPGLDAADPEPVRDHRRRARLGPGVHGLPEVRRRPEALRRDGLPPARRRGRRRGRRAPTTRATRSPSPRRCSPSTTTSAVGQTPTRSTSTRTAGIITQIQAEAGE